MTTAVVMSYKNMCLCSYLGSSFIQSETNDNGIIPYSSRITTVSCLTQYDSIVRVKNSLLFV
jgi:hypothetical protein